MIWIMGFILGCGDEETTTPTSDLDESWDTVEQLQQELDALKSHEHLPGSDGAAIIVKDLPPPINEIPHTAPLPEEINEVPTILARGVGIITHCNVNEAAIYIINPDGTNNTFVALGLHPELSPDRRFIVYTHLANIPEIIWDLEQWRREGRFEGSQIFITRIDGARTFQLTHSHDLDGHYDPTWSRDGKMIAFRYFGGNIYVVNSDGTNRRLVTDEGGEHLSWSPDSRQLAFQDHGDVRTINIDGTNLQVVVENASHPDWGPDGRIVYASNKSGWSEIHIIDLHTQMTTWITSGWHPSWSPDARHIVYEHRDGIHVVDTSGAINIWRESIIAGGDQPNWR